MTVELVGILKDYVLILNTIFVFFKMLKFEFVLKF